MFYVRVMISHEYSKRTCNNLLSEGNSAVPIRVSGWNIAVGSLLLSLVCCRMEVQNEASSEFEIRIGSFSLRCDEWISQSLEATRKAS